MPENFDRVHDVSKLIGCYTRGVEYRWSIFTSHLEDLPPSALALDFGSGSLRETYDLSQRGFRAVALDLDEARMKRFAESYPWPEPPTLVAGTPHDLLQHIDTERFSLMLLFDVLEHVDSPGAILEEIVPLLAPKGLVFVSAPNKYAVSEIMRRIVLWGMKACRWRWTPGVPHIQFKTHGQWVRLFEDNGLKVLEHDHAIGFLVNTVAALLFLPLSVLARLTRLPFNRLRPLFEQSRIPKLLDRVDRRCPRWMRGLWGWNLYVLQRSGDPLEPPPAPRLPE